MHTVNSDGADEGMRFAAVENRTAFPASGTLQSPLQIQTSHGSEPWSRQVCFSGLLLPLIVQMLA